MKSSLVLVRRCADLIRPWLFPLVVSGFYGVGMMAAPENTLRAWGFCVAMFEKLAIPLCLAFAIMVVFNRFLSPALVARFLGTGSGLKGMLLSSLAGVLSMGPIYAWFPLFKNLKEKGAAVFIVANFIGCRSVKPALFPVLIGYFGWRFSGAFVLMSLAGALITAYVVAKTCPPDSKTGV